MRKWLVVSLLVIAPTGAVQTARANISEAAVLFLVIPNSPRSNAMGNCEITLVDARSGVYNPGTMGILHLDKIAAQSFPNTEAWLPALTSDLNLRTNNFSDGVSWNLLTGKSGRFDASASFGYARHELDLGTQVVVDEFGNIVGFSQSKEEAELYTGSVAIQYYVKLGIGFTHKNIRSDLGYPGAGVALDENSGKAKAWDIGLYAELPLSGRWSPGADSGSSRRYPLSFELTPALAYVNANNGDDIYYVVASQSDPLPHMQHFGVSVYTAARKGPAVAASLRLAWQMNQDLVGSDHQTTQGGGAELGLLGAVYLRMGRYVDQNGDIHMTTVGYGLSLSGLLSWAGVIWAHDQESGVLKYLRNHLDVTYDFAKYNEDNDGPVNGTKFTSITFSF